MNIQKILLLILIVYSIIITFVMLINIKFSIIRFARNNILLSAICLLPALALAITIVIIDKRGGLRDVLYKVTAFCIPIMCFCVIIAYDYMHYLRSIIDKADKQ